MAVQAALLSTHPFVPFGFGGSADGLGGAFGGGLDQGCCFDDDESGAAAAGALLSGVEGGDVREATRDLLSFIDSASSNIKLALDKPGKSKRKVNHRKYLQKQIKRCSGLVGAAHPGPPSPSPGAATDTPAKRPPVTPSSATAAVTPAPGKAGPRREASQAAAASSLQSRSLAALFDSLRHVPGGGAEPAAGAVTAPAASALRAAGGDAAGPAGVSAVLGPKKVPLRARNLPPSFFTEPSRAAGGVGGCGPSSGPGVSLGELEKGAEAGEFFELLAPDYGGAASDAGVLLSAEPLDVFPGAAAGLRGPLELEPGLFEPPPAMVGNLLYPEPWSAPSCPQTKKPPQAAGRAGGLTLNEPLRPLYPAAADSPGGEDAPGPLASLAPFFPDCALPPPHPLSYDYGGGAGYGRGPYSGLWRPDGGWEGATGDEAPHRD